MDFEQGLRMAGLMKAKSDEIIAAIGQVKTANHGVVALNFSNECRDMDIVILDEPYEPNVRVYPG